MDVFISYATEDKKIADAVCSVLENRRIRCWVAPRDVLPDQPYAEQVVRAIDSASLMVLVFSHHSNNSKQVHREVERAVVDKGIPVVTFRTEDIQPDDAMSLYLETLHWLDAIPPTATEHLNRLVHDSEVLLSREGATVEDKRPESQIAPRHPIAVRTWALYAIGLLVAVVAFYAIHRVWFSPPELRTEVERPKHGEKVLGLGSPLIYRWKPVVSDTDGVSYRIQRRVQGGSSLRHETNMTAYEEEEQLEGVIEWQVRVIQHDHAGTRWEGPWTEWQEVEFYRDAWARICATRTVSVGVGKKDGLFITESARGTLGGPEIELIRDLFQSGLDRAGNCGTGAVSIKEGAYVTWGEAFFRLLDNPSIDLLASRISITAKREDDYRIKFTDPYIEYPQSLVTLKGSEPFRNGRFRLRVVGAQEKSTNSWLAGKLLGPSHETLVAHRDGQESEIPTSPDGPLLVLWAGDLTDDYELQALVNKKIEGIVADQPYAMLLRSRAKDLLDLHNIAPNTVPGYDLERIGIATRFMDSKLREVLNQAINDHPEYKKEFRERVIGDKQVASSVGSH